MNFVIRPLEARDLLPLEWGGEYSHFRHKHRTDYQRSLRGEIYYLVADIQGFPAGQIIFKTHDPNPQNSYLTDGITRGYLFSLRVHPDYRRHGIGLALTQAAENQLLRQGFTIATICVAKTNTYAKTLYEKWGYHTTRDHIGYWSYQDLDGTVKYHADPEWVMEKHLSGVDKT
ncbi:MAG: GNAT family N-acetyltransferase [Candidatus Chisholmbacteria bacterium]|nr:GNAT family N-acetyltransferase [Candidatus Chisholmbacteria bacterium]